MWKLTQILVWAKQAIIWSAGECGSEITCKATWVKSKCKEYTDYLFNQKAEVNPWRQLGGKCRCKTNQCSALIQSRPDCITVLLVCIRLVGRQFIAWQASPCWLSLTALKLKNITKYSIFLDYTVQIWTYFYKVGHFLFEWMWSVLLGSNPPLCYLMNWSSANDFLFHMFSNLEPRELALGQCVFVHNFNQVAILCYLGHKQPCLSSNTSTPLKFKCSVCDLCHAVGVYSYLNNMYRYILYWTVYWTTVTH